MKYLQVLVGTERGRFIDFRQVWVERCSWVKELSQWMTLGGLQVTEPVLQALINLSEECERNC